MTDYTQSHKPQVSCPLVSNHSEATPRMWPRPGNQKARLWLPLSKGLGAGMREMLPASSPHAHSELP